MSVSLKVKAYSSTDNPEFQKHFEAVKFCIKNDLSYPAETSEFFKSVDDFDDLKPEYALDYIENGLEIEMPFVTRIHECKYHIRVSDIPKEADLIVVELS